MFHPYTINKKFQSLYAQNVSFRIFDFVPVNNPYQGHPVYKTTCFRITKEYSECYPVD